MPNKPKKVREQVMVYLDRRDRDLLERLARTTGLARTELLRQGLWQLASQALGEKKPGSSMEYLVATATDDDFPPDIAERHDNYLYGGGYEKRSRRRKPRARKKVARSS